MTYADIIAANRALGKDMQGEGYRVRVLTNLTITPFRDFLEYHARCRGIPARVHFGNYGDFIQGSRDIQADCVVVFWDLTNLYEGVAADVVVLPEADLDAIVESTCAAIALVLQQLAHVPTVVFNRFTSAAYERRCPKPGPLTYLAGRLNAFLDASRQRNVHLVDMDRVMGSCSIAAAVDIQKFHASKALYTMEFFREYVQHVLPHIAAATGRTKKVLLMDCDNTLWDGILGENPNGVVCDGSTARGACFREVQALVRKAAADGVLVGLCSKNNPEDVIEQLRAGHGMLLRESDITVQKVNWRTKVENIVSIAEELNLPLDSMVFVDDSMHEIEHVRMALPSVETVLVPEDVYQYPQLMRNVLLLFHRDSITDEDRRKAELYRARAMADAERASFSSPDDFLRSLRMRMTVYLDAMEHIARIAQLTQKTNQFNLTTHRYTDQEIESFVRDRGTSVFSFSVEDRFVNSGLTGVMIVRRSELDATIDTMLVSCRVLGRNLERSFANHVLSALRSEGIQRVLASYRPTSKNAQVETFWDLMGFSATGTDEDGNRRYELALSSHTPVLPGYIEVEHG